MALVWNTMRIWLGVTWLQGRIAKIWGAKNPAFMHNGGAGVDGFTSGYRQCHVEPKMVRQEETPDVVVPDYVAPEVKETPVPVEV